MSEENLENLDKTEVENLDETGEVSIAESAENPPSKLRQAIIAFIVLTVLIAGGYAYWLYTRPAAQTEARSRKTLDRLPDVSEDADHADEEPGPSEPD